MKQFILFFTLALTIGCSSEDPVKKALELKPIPSFSLLLPDSATWVNNASIQKGKPVVMFFFSPHCPYCRAQMDDMVKNMENLKNIQFYLLTNTNFAMTDIKDFYNQYQLAAYPNIIVGKDTSNLSIKYFKTPGLPFTAVFHKGRQPSKFFLGKTATKEILQAAEE